MAFARTSSLKQDLHAHRIEFYVQAKATVLGVAQKVVDDSPGRRGHKRYLPRVHRQGALAFLRKVAKACQLVAHLAKGRHPVACATVRDAAHSKLIEALAPAGVGAEHTLAQMTLRSLTRTSPISLGGEKISPVCLSQERSCPEGDAA